MSTFLAEPKWEHDQPRRVGVLLMNLGTPDAATPSAVRRYLGEFLSDRRVVEIPPFLWKPILHLAVLRVRPAQSAKKYAMIWGADGSPLLVHSQKQKTLLMGYLGQRLKESGLPADMAQVELAMRYGSPRRCGRLRPAHRGGVRPHPRRAALSAIFRKRHGCSTRRSVRACPARAAVARIAHDRKLS
jgi:ferrochelatase